MMFRSGSQWKYVSGDGSSLKSCDCIQSDTWPDEAAV